MRQDRLNNIVEGVIQNLTIFEGSNMNFFFSIKRIRGIQKHKWIKTNEKPLVILTFLVLISKFPQVKSNVPLACCYSAICYVFQFQKKLFKIRKSLLLPPFFNGANATTSVGAAYSLPCTIPCLYVQHMPKTLFFVWVTTRPLCLEYFQEV